MTTFGFRTDRSVAKRRNKIKILAPNQLLEKQAFLPIGE